MPRSPKAKNALKRTVTHPALAVEATADPMATFRGWLRTVRLAATEVQFDLDDVDDREDRQTGIEEASQKIGALLRECEKLDKQAKHVLGIVDEIQRETPNIAARIGVDLEG